MRSPPSRLCVQAVTKAGYDAILSAPWYLNLGCYATQVGAAAGGGGGSCLQAFLRLAGGVGSNERQLEGGRPGQAPTARHEGGLH